MRNSGRGRYVQFQRVTRHRPPRAPAAVFAAPVCLTESFDGASWPIGSDLTWEEGHIGNPNGLGANVLSDGSDALKRTLHVVGDTLTVKYPDNSQLPGGSTHWDTAGGFVRTVAELGAADMRVSATIGGVSNNFPDYFLVARSFPHAQEVLNTGFIPGWQADFEDGFLFVQCWYQSSTMAPGDLTNGGFAAVVSGVPSLVDGDEIAMTVTGTGTSTVVTVELNGATLTTLNQANNWDDGPGTGSLVPGDSPDDFATGLQGGAGLVMFRPSTDDVTTLDNWSMCPA